MKFARVDREWEGRLIALTSVHVYESRVLVRVRVRIVGIPGKVRGSLVVQCAVLLRLGHVRMFAFFEYAVLDYLADISQTTGI